MNVKILLVKEFRVHTHFWVSCPMLTEVNGEEMIIHMFLARKYFASLCVSVAEHSYSKGSISTGLSEGRIPKHNTYLPGTLSWLLNLIF